MSPAGDVANLTTLGKRLLVGEGLPVSIDKGIATLGDAASRGGGEAAAVLSVCAAWGLGQPRNIDAALDHLTHAAQLGWEPARRELELLARDSGPEPAALRRKIDLASWRSAPKARVQFEQPRVVVIERFASEQECQWLIGRAAGGGLQRAKVYRGSATAQVAETRTNREMSFTIFNADVVLSLIRDRISAAAGAPALAFRDSEAAALLAWRAVRVARGLHRGEDARAGARARGTRSAFGHLPHLSERRVRRRRDAVPATVLAVPRRARRRAAVQQRGCERRARPTTPSMPGCRRRPARSGCCRSGFGPDPSVRDRRYSSRSAAFSENRISSSMFDLAVPSPVAS